MKRGQVSLEYMMVVGFTLLMIMPIVAIYGIEKSSIENKVNTRQAHTIARQLADASEKVYYLGEPAKTTLKVYMPSHVETVSIGNREIVFVMDIDGTSTEIVADSAVNISGTVSPKQGIQYIEVAAQGYEVNITSS